MRSKHAVRYYLVITALLLFFYFSNDFGLIDIQKSALILAVGIDREDTEFIVTTQIAVPQSSAQGKEASAVQLESRGGTVADALNQDGLVPQTGILQPDRSRRRDGETQRIRRVGFLSAG